MESIQQRLGSVSKTLLMTLAVRAKITREQPDLFFDPRAVEMVSRLQMSLTEFKMHRHDELGVVMRMAHLDSIVKRFLAVHPDGAVVHLGCGLDTRFDRVDNGRVSWFDLDVPEVIQLRKQLLSEGNPRYQHIANSAFSLEWYALLDPYLDKAKLFIAEGVLQYFPEEEVKGLFVRLHDRYKGCEIAADAHTPFAVKLVNLELKAGKMATRMHWGLENPANVEKWAEGIKLLEAWYYFEEAQSPLARYKWMKFIPAISKSTGIFHYRLGAQ